MQIRIGNHTVSIEPGPVLFTLGGLLWAFLHYRSVRTSEFVEPADFILIEPLFYIGLVAGAFVIWKSIHLSADFGNDDTKDPDQRFLHPKRLAFFIALPLYLVGLWHFGFLIPSLVLVTVLAYFLGVRSWRPHVSLLVIVILMVWIGFATLLEVPVPLGP